MATDRIFNTQQMHDMVQEAGIVSLLFHGSGSLIHSEGVNGLCQDDLERLLAIACRAYASHAVQQPAQEGADCDQAFEEQYKCSARDPGNADNLAIWRAAWAAKGAAIKALQDRIDTLNSSLECEKRMRKDAEEDAERWRAFANAIDRSRATARFGVGPGSKLYAYSRALAADLDAEMEKAR